MFGSGKAVLAFLTYVGFFSLPTNAQEFTRTELGVATPILVNNRLGTANEAGLAGRFTYNFSSSFAIDSEFASYFDKPTLISPQSGGRAITALVGAKAGIRRERFGVFFKARPGIMSFSNAVVSDSPDGTFQTGRKTHAALDLGGVAELYLKRFIVRLDLGQLLVRYGDSTAFVIPLSSTLNLVATNIGYVGNPLYLSLGASYRLGSFRKDNEVLQSVDQPFHFGLQYSLQTLPRAFVSLRDESAAGGWLTYDLTKHFSLDAAAGFYPREHHDISFQEGGQMIQAVAGLRWGIRHGRWGVFAKFRPGLQIYTLTAGFDFRDLFNPNQKLPTFANLAFDNGGVFEIYTSKHTMVRLDAANTAIHFRQRHFLDVNGGPFTVSGSNESSIQLTAGFGLTF